MSSGMSWVMISCNRQRSESLKLFKVLISIFPCFAYFECSSAVYACSSMLDLCQCIASIEDHHNEALFASKKNVLIFNSFEAIVRSLPRFSFTGESPVVISSSLLISSSFGWRKCRRAKLQNWSSCWWPYFLIISSDNPLDNRPTIWHSKSRSLTKASWSTVRRSTV